MTSSGHFRKSICLSSPPSWVLGTYLFIKVYPSESLLSWAGCLARKIVQKDRRWTKCCGLETYEITQKQEASCLVSAHDEHSSSTSSSTRKSMEARIGCTSALQPTHIFFSFAPCCILHSTPPLLKTEHWRENRKKQLCMRRQGPSGIIRDLILYTLIFFVRPSQEAFDYLQEISTRGIYIVLAQDS